MHKLAISCTTSSSASGRKPVAPLFSSHIMFAKQSATAIVSRSLLYVRDASSGNSILNCLDHDIYKTIQLTKARAIFWTTCGRKSTAASILHSYLRMRDENIAYTCKQL